MQARLRVKGSILRIECTYFMMCLKLDLLTRKQKTVQAVNPDVRLFFEEKLSALLISLNLCVCFEVSYGSE